VPVNSGANPEAPLGGQITQFSAVPEPEEFPAPVVAAPPEEVVVPREVVPADPLGAVELELDVVPLAAAVVPAVVEVVVVAVVGLPVVVNDGATGSATAPPEVGKPLRVAALPTFPVVGVATWARAGLAAASSRAIANSDARVISKQRAIA
jgi:hypothetical protein